MASQKVEELNYYRLYRLVNSVGAKAVKVKFDQIFPLATLAATLNQNRNKISPPPPKKPCKWVNNAQLKLLYPPGSAAVSSSDFDITLMVALIRNLATSVNPPINGFDKPPLKTEISDGADLARMKCYRNKLAHLQPCEVDTVDFNDYWTDISEAVVRLGGPSFQAMCDSLAKEVIDRDMLMQLRREVDELKNEMQDSRKATRDERKKQLYDDALNWVKTQAKDTTFVETKIIEDGLRYLRETGVVVLAGKAGSGKSRNSVHIIRSFMSEYPNVRVVKLAQLGKIDDIIDGTDDTMTLILFEDIFGRTNCLYNEETDYKLLDKVLSYVESGGLKIIVTVRNTVQLQCQNIFTTHRLFTRNNILDLDSSSYKLSVDDKSKLLVQYFQDRFSRSTITQTEGFLDDDGVCRITYEDAEAIVRTDTYFGFPQTVYMFVNNYNSLKLGRWFFKRPPKATVDDINSIRQQGNTDKAARVQYAVLALTFFCGNKIINPSLPKNTKTIEAIIRKIYGIDDVITTGSIVDAVKQLDTIYLASVPVESSCYSFQHQVILESVLMSIAELDISKMIPYLDLTTIYEMVRGDLYETKEGEVVLKVPPACYKAFAERVAEIVFSWTILERRKEVLECLFRAELFRSCGKVFVLYCLDYYNRYKNLDKSEYIYFEDPNATFRQLHTKENMLLPVALLEYFSQKKDQLDLFFTTLGFIEKILGEQSNPEETRACRLGLIRSIYRLCRFADEIVIETVMNKAEDVGVIFDDQISLQAIVHQADIVSVQNCICQALSSGNILVADFMLCNYVSDSFDISQLSSCISSFNDVTLRSQGFKWLISKIDDGEGKIKILKDSIKSGVDNVLKSEWNQSYVGENEKKSLLSVCESYRRFELIFWIIETNDIEQTICCEHLQRLIPDISLESLLKGCKADQEQGSENVRLFIDHLALDKKVYIAHSCRIGYFEVVKWFIQQYPDENFQFLCILKHACCVAHEDMVSWMLSTVDKKHFDFNSAMLCAISGSLEETRTVQVTANNYNEKDDRKRLRIVKMLWCSIIDTAVIDKYKIVSTACLSVKFKILIWFQETVGFDDLDMEVCKDVVKLSFQYEYYDACDLLLDKVLSPDNASEFLLLLVTGYNKSSYTIGNMEFLPKNHPMVIENEKMRQRKDKSRIRRDEITKFILKTFDHDILGISELMRRCLRYESFCSVTILLEHCKDTYFDMQNLLNQAGKYAQVDIVRTVLNKRSYKHLDKNAALVSTVMADIIGCPDTLIEERLTVMNILWKSGKKQKVEFKVDDVIHASFADPNFKIIEWILEKFGKTADIVRKMVRICCREGYVDTLKFLIWKEADFVRLIDIEKSLLEVCNPKSLYPIMRGDMSVERVAIIKMLLKMFGKKAFKTCIEKPMKMAFENRLFDVVLFFLENGFNGNVDVKDVMAVSCTFGSSELVNFLCSTFSEEELEIHECFLKACSGHTYSEQGRLHCIIVLSERFENERFPWVDGYRVAKESGSTHIVQWIEHRKKSTLIRNELLDLDGPKNMGTSVDCFKTNPGTDISQKTQEDVCSGEIVDPKERQCGPSTTSEDKYVVAQNTAPHSRNSEAETRDSPDFTDFNNRDRSNTSAVGDKDRSGSSSPEYYCENGLETEV